MRIYHRLVVVASEPRTDIWLVDDCWHPVQKATGELNTSVLAGRYLVEFGPAGPAGSAYPIELVRDMQLTQHELEAGPFSPRRPPEMLDD